jgi:uncharacterized protein (TIGR01777 family)
MAKVLITGGTGAIGKRLTEMLIEDGHEVVHTSRSPGGLKNIPTYQWDVKAGTMDPKALEGVNSIIHLAGAGIADKPWTDERKQEIIDSRVASAKLLLKTCKAQNITLDHFISASAIGWYPLILSDKMYNEESEAGDGFLAEVCRLWEESADAFKGVAAHVSKIRIGLVLAKDEGALKEISLPVKYYAAAGLGKGQQYMSWIHKTDVCRVFQHVLDNQLDGVYNAVGPDPTRNEDFMQILADVMEKPMFLPNVPEVVIRLLFGDKADLVLKGVPLSSEKIQKTGFTFDYPTLNSALMHIYSDAELK